MSDDCLYFAKIVLVGDSGVGKTSLMLRFIENEYTDTFISTIGIDFKVRDINFDDKSMKLQLWDTAGQERFRTITTSYYRGADGIILVYDVTDRHTFDNLQFWLNEMKLFINKDTVIFLFGSKPDLIENRNVSYEEGKEFADANNMLFMEGSAKENKNVMILFETLARSIYAIKYKNFISIKETMDANKKDLIFLGDYNKRTGWCCY